MSHIKKHNMRHLNTFQTTQDQLVARVVSELKNELKQATFTEQYLTREEVSKLLKISLSTIHNWTKRGILQPFQIGGRIYFKASHIECSMIKLEK
ncbi:helix-turn-helix domain-containing protein [Winogradskyella sp.]|nr:helix-turn-helix domain-containing protein [Winogradskyella sp.]MDB4752598.1 helix-turn-helix domain-containing protein [Winogradskyella sp.]